MSEPAEWDVIGKSKPKSELKNAAIAKWGTWLAYVRMAQSYITDGGSRDHTFCFPSRTNSTEGPYASHARLAFSNTSAHVHSTPSYRPSAV